MAEAHLEPCPFCEANAKLQQTADVALWYFAECTRCFTRQLASETPDEAVHRWNTRGANWTWRPRNG